MSSPDSSDKLGLTIHPSLLELDGTTYKDLSHSAAAKRAAYHTTLGLFSILGKEARSNVTTHEQTFSTFSPDGSPNGLINRYDYFSNYRAYPGYTLQGGTQGEGSEGWIMHSAGVDDSSQLRFDFVFNDGSAPFTLIAVVMRGAPDNGKNSYACLREARCGDDPENQRDCDEVDIVEYYGYPSDPRAEWTTFQSGREIDHGPYPKASGNYDPGHAAYTYMLYLERGNYISLQVYGPFGSNIHGFWEKHISQGYVSAQPMYFYAGIWDCLSSDPSACDDGSGPFNGDSYMAIAMVGYRTYNPK